jgi:tetratricopeptide (TPR) repeat protein
MTPYVAAFAEKWGTLASVLKICGDFQCESFEVTQSQENSAEAIQLYKRRAELDKRAEAFIDLAHALQLHGNVEGSVTVLRRVLRTFSDHAGLWMHLGISFALSGRFPFARHCFCVAAKIATDCEAARSFSCCAAIALLIDDENLLKVATDSARRFNPYDPDVWQVLSHGDTLSALDSALIAFEFGAAVQNHLVHLCLSANKINEALGFALMTGDGEEISLCFEAQQRYDLALLYTDAHGTRERLELLLQKQTRGAFELYQNRQFDNAASMFQARGDVYGRLAAGVCLVASGKKAEGCEMLDLVRADAPYFGSQIDKLLFKYSDEPIQSRFAQKDPQMFFLEQLQKHTRVEAAHGCIKRFPSDPIAMEIFVLKSLESGSNEEITAELVTKARALYDVKPGRKSLMLFVVTLVRSRLWKEAAPPMQTLCLLAPNLLPVVRPLMAKLAALANEN